MYLNEADNELRAREESNHEACSDNATEVEPHSSENWVVASIASLSAEVPSNGVSTDTEAEEFLEESKAPVELNEH